MFAFSLPPNIVFIPLVTAVIPEGISYIFNKLPQSENALVSISSQFGNKVISRKFVHPLNAKPSNPCVPVALESSFTIPLKSTILSLLLSSIVEKALNIPL